MAYLDMRQHYKKAIHLEAFIIMHYSVKVFLLILLDLFQKVTYTVFGIINIPRNTKNMFRGNLDE